MRSIEFDDFTYISVPISEGSWRISSLTQHNESLIPSEAGTQFTVEERRKAYAINKCFYSLLGQPLPEFEH